MRFGRSGQRVVDRRLVGPFGGVLEIGAGPGVVEIGGGHVGQRLRRRHVVVVQLARRVAVEVESTELAVALAQREGEHRRQPGLDGSGAEDLETILVAEIGHGDGVARPVGGEAGTLVQFGLELFVAQRRFVGGGDIVG